MTTYYDAWQQVTTKNGFTADEIISGLQKSIRRSDQENALAMAYEIYYFRATRRLHVETLASNQC